MHELTPRPPRSHRQGARSAHRWPQRVGVAIVVVTAVAAAAGWSVVLFFPDAWPLGGEQTIVTPSAATTGPSEGGEVLSGPSPATRQMNPEPHAVTLRTTDLPPGYHVLHAGPASFSSTGGEEQPSSWDVVFAPDLAQTAEPLLIESVVAVYSDAATADAAVEMEDAAERSAHALEQAPVSSLGDRQAIWVQPAPDRATYGVTRVTWQSINVVGQISTLGPMTPLVLGVTVHLATVEQDRIERGGRPVPGSRQSRDS